MPDWAKELFNYGVLGIIAGKDWPIGVRLDFDDEDAAELYK